MRVPDDQRVQDNPKYKKSAKLRYFARNYITFYIYSTYQPTNEGYRFKYTNVSLLLLVKN